MLFLTLAWEIKRLSSGTPIAFGTSILAVASKESANGQ